MITENFTFQYRLYVIFFLPIVVVQRTVNPHKYEIIIYLNIFFYQLNEPRSGEFQPKALKTFFNCSWVI